jgi:hypothetical protein
MPLIDEDLESKHERMASDAFSFLRGTFYRWSETFPQILPGLAATPQVAGIGDLHVENFGTWRDSEGRLAWGINDFDEATWLPFANDLVRLSTSALLAADAASLEITPRKACTAILRGYTECLKSNGLPIVLAEGHPWLRELAAYRLKEERRYWEKLVSLPQVEAAVDPGARRGLHRTLPRPRATLRMVHRRGGLGSMGRPRVMALMTWQGGLVAREAKALTSSAWHWRVAPDRSDICYSQILSRAVRAPDPFLAVHDAWVVRRLAPDCSRIELADVPKKSDQQKLLWMMGWETANVHIGSAGHRKAILADLSRRKPLWLHGAAELMRDATLEDWRSWRKAQ